MLLVLVMGAALWGVGWAMKAPIRARVVMVGLLFAGVVLGHLVLPAGHPLRAATGGSAQPWLILGGLAVSTLLTLFVIPALLAFLIGHDHPVEDLD